MTGWVGLVWGGMGRQAVLPSNVPLRLLLLLLLQLQLQLLHYRAAVLTSLHSLCVAPVCPRSLHQRGAAVARGVHRGVG